MFYSHFEPKSVNYQTFFDEASKTQIIPALQRIYTWEEKHIEKLFQDIIENEPGYFVGTLVLIGSRSSASRDEVIDGQQRLTTLSIFMIALRDILQNRPDFSHIVDEINQLLLNPKLKGLPDRRLKFTNDSADLIFESLVSSTKSPKDVNDLQQRFLDNYDACKDLILEFSPQLDFGKMEELFNKFKSLELVYIGCYDKSSAYKLFSSLNATAVSLASTDLIKNSLLMTLSKNPEDLTKAETQWLSLEENFANELGLLPKFIRHQWISQGEYTTEPSLFDKFQKRYVDAENVKGVKEYLDGLLSDSELYLNFRNANIENLENLPPARFDRREVKETLEFLSYLNVDQVYSVLLSVYKNEKTFKNNLIKLTAFQFLFKHVPGSPSKVETLFAQYSSGTINLEKLFAELLKLCRNQSENFTDSFLNKTKYRPGGGKNGDLQFLLEKYLLDLGPNKIFSKPTIEHIVPQTPEKTDKVKLREQFGDLKQYNLYKHKIGNLTILEKSDNSSSDYSNKMFEEKRKYFENDLYLGNKELVVHPFSDNPSFAIDFRGKILAESIYKIFLRALQSGQWVEPQNKEVKD